MTVDVFTVESSYHVYDRCIGAILLLNMFVFGRKFWRLIIGAALLPWWSLSWSQDSTEVPNPPSIPTAEQRSQAERTAKTQPAPERPEAVVGIQSRETVVGSSTVTEFRRGDQVFMVRVKPKNAPAQYIDESLPGGQLVPNDPGISEDTQTNLPKWRLGSF